MVVVLPLLLKPGAHEATVAVWRAELSRAVAVEESVAAVEEWWSCSEWKRKVLVLKRGKSFTLEQPPPTPPSRT
jgi:hypothetical protein